MRTKICIIIIFVSFVFINCSTKVETLPAIGEQYTEKITQPCLIMHPIYLWHGPFYINVDVIVDDVSYKLGLDKKTYEVDWIISYDTTLTVNPYRIGDKWDGEIVSNARRISTTPIPAIGKLGDWYVKLSYEDSTTITAFFKD